MKTFNCNFNQLNICGFVNEDDNEAQWTHHDVESGKDIGGTAAGMPLTDASQHITDPGRYLYIEEGSGSLISRVFDHHANQAQCVIVWTWMTTGKITIEFWTSDPDYGEKVEMQDYFEITADRESRWQFNQYTYTPLQNNFKVRVVYEGNDFAAIDDLSIQEDACRPNYFIIENFSERLAAAQEAVKVWGFKFVFFYL